jgi:prophage tail gpP-like protein
VAEIGLRVGGREYGGWQSVRVANGIESIAGSFDLSVSDRWNGQTDPWPINEEDECSIVIGNTVILTGHVDRRSVSYGSGEHTLSVSGRDLAGALVDCSAVLKSWEFKNLAIIDLAKRLAEPFGIQVRLDDNVQAKAVTAKTGKDRSGRGTGGGGRVGGGFGLPKPPRKFSIDPGETAFEVLDRACRLAGVLPVSDGHGGIVLTRAGNARAVTELVQGENILSASAEFDASGRYRTYIVSAQHQATEDWAGGHVVNVKGTAQDLNVRRASRILYIRPESSATPGSAKVRAAWEAKVRAVRGDSVSVRVQGWTQGDGSLWPVNALVRVRSPLLGIDGDMLITQREFTCDLGAGSTTHLTLRRPDAFIPEPTVSTAGTNIWKELTPEKGEPKGVL